MILSTCTFNCLVVCILTHLHEVSVNFCMLVKFQQCLLWRVQLGMAPSRCQVIMGSSADPIHWRIYASWCLNESQIFTDVSPTTSKWINLWFSVFQYVFVRTLYFHCSNIFRENIICDRTAVISKRPTKQSELFMTRFFSLGIVDCHDNIDHIWE